MSILRTFCQTIKVSDCISKSLSQQNLGYPSPCHCFLKYVIVVCKLYSFGQSMPTNQSSLTQSFWKVPPGRQATAQKYQILRMIYVFQRKNAIYYLFITFRYFFNAFFVFYAILCAQNLSTTILAAQKNTFLESLV